MARLIRCKSGSGTFARFWRWGVPACGPAMVCPGTDHEILADAPQRRAVIVGTGIYSDGRGQITTTRNTDGSHGPMFDLIT
jgi:hypothetical protein